MLIIYRPPLDSVSRTQNRPLQSSHILVLIPSHLCSAAMAAQDLDFLSLPAELRVEVYKFYYDDLKDNSYDLLSAGKDTLLCTCDDIRREAEPIFFELTRFYLPVSTRRQYYHALYWLNRLDDNLALQIRELDLIYHDRQYMSFKYRTVKIDLRKREVRHGYSGGHQRDQQRQRDWEHGLMSLVSSSCLTKGKDMALGAQAWKMLVGYITITAVAH